MRTVFSLGGYAFDTVNLEVPSELTAGYKLAGSAHKYATANGAPQKVFQYWGVFPVDQISWVGIFRGSQASTKIRNLQAMMSQKATVQLVDADRSWSVVILEVGDVKKHANWWEAHFTVEVMSATSGAVSNATPATSISSALSASSAQVATGANTVTSQLQSFLDGDPSLGQSVSPSDLQTLSTNASNISPEEEAAEIQQNAINGAALPPGSPTGYQGAPVPDEAPPASVMPSAVGVANSATATSAAITATQPEQLSGVPDLVALNTQVSNTLQQTTALNATLAQNNDPGSLALYATTAPLQESLTNYSANLSALTGQDGSNAVVMNGGDLYSLSATTYGDWTRFTDIMAVNGMDDPYLTGRTTINLPSVGAGTSSS